MTIDLPYLEHGWRTHIRGRLLALDGAIWIEDVWVPPPQREGDKLIMEDIAKLPGIRKKDIIKSNNVRLYLRVITISDMTTVDGKAIDADCFSGTWRADSSLRWPEQPCPPQSAFNTFRTLIKRAFCTRNMRCRNR